jgi:flagellar basal-body rod protein FlgC
MTESGPFRLLDLSSSALQAEFVRLTVIQKNIANAQVTRTEDGRPYRRQTVAFETVLGDARRQGLPQGSVRIRGIQEDHSPFRLVRDPGHADANEEGWVQYPNVNLSGELVDLMQASQSYEANLAAIRTYREMMRQTLSITQ